jgi:endonuclease-3
VSLSRADKHEHDWQRIFQILKETVGRAPLPSVSEVAEQSRDPFRILISTMISLRTKDEVTTAASNRLFARADTPEGIAALSPDTIADIIFPAGFYNTKGTNIHIAARTIAEEHGGKTPDTLEGLTALPGVGRKTANLVLGLGFGIPAICVDTHVHRIPNRLGWIETEKPQQTEHALMAILPKEYWIEINGLLVGFGQKVCTPQSPWCSKCPLEPECEKVGVKKSR